MYSNVSTNNFNKIKTKTMPKLNNWTLDGKV